MGSCSRCGKPIRSLDFYASTGKYRITGMLQTNGSATIDLAGTTSDRDLGFHCPECGEFLTDNAKAAKEILSDP